MGGPDRLGPKIKKGRDPGTGFLMSAARHAFSTSGVEAIPIVQHDGHLHLTRSQSQFTTHPLLLSSTCGAITLLLKSIGTAQALGRRSASQYTLLQESNRINRCTYTKERGWDIIAEERKSRRSMRPGGAMGNVRDATWSRTEQEASMEQAGQLTREDT